LNETDCIPGYCGHFAPEERAQEFAAALSATLATPLT